MALSASFLRSLSNKTKPQGGSSGAPGVSGMSRMSASGGGAKAYTPSVQYAPATTSAPSWSPSYTGTVPTVTADQVTAPTVQAQQIGQSDLYNQLTNQASSELALGGRLGAGEQRDAAQQARAAMAARGMAVGPAAIFAEALNRDKYANARQAERQAFAQSTEQLGQPIRLADQAAENAARSQNASMNLTAGVSNQGANLNAGQSNQSAALQQKMQAEDLSAGMARQQADIANQQAMQGSASATQKELAAMDINAGVSDWMRNAMEARNIRDYNMGVSNETQAQIDAQAKKDELSKRKQALAFSGKQSQPGGGFTTIRWD